MLCCLGLTSASLYNTLVTNCGERYIQARPILHIAALATRCLCCVRMHNSASAWHGKALQGTAWTAQNSMPACLTLEHTCISLASHAHLATIVPLAIATARSTLCCAALTSASLGSSTCSFCKLVQLPSCSCFCGFLKRTAS